jgi:hypothetical protein
VLHLHRTEHPRLDAALLLAAAKKPGRGRCWLGDAI